MKRVFLLVLSVIIILTCAACTNPGPQIDIVASTLPVYDITAKLCSNTDLSVARLVTENVSCLHDYTLNPNQMKLAESAKLLVISGAGFEDFMGDVIDSAQNVTDASTGIPLHCAEHTHEETHSHEHDPHIWLSPKNGKLMAENIHADLCSLYPEHKKQLDENLLVLQSDFDKLTQSAETQLSAVSCKKLITFHDGFSYMADSFGLEILHSIEEESGSEASAADLIAICNLINQHNIPAIFVETNGSDRAATIIAKETGVKIFKLDTGLSGNSYFDALKHNIDTLKEALE